MTGDGYSCRATVPSFLHGAARAQRGPHRSPKP